MAEIIVYFIYVVTMIGTNGAWYLHCDKRYNEWKNKCTKIINDWADLCERQREDYTTLFKQAEKDWQKCIKAILEERESNA